MPRKYKKIKLGVKKLKKHLALSKKNRNATSETNIKKVLWIR